MRRDIVYFSLALSFVTAPAAVRDSPQQAEDTGRVAKPIARVSFDLYNNRVYLPVEVNGEKAFEMVLDTGAAASGLSEAIAKSIGLKAAGKAQLSGNGESRLKITIARGVTFRVGAAELVEKTVAIVPFDELETHEGRPLAGVLGVDLFRRYVVVVDYAAKTLALYEPAGFVYRGGGVKIPLRVRGAALFQASVEAGGSDPLGCNLAVDLGTYSGLRLYRPYAQRHHLPGAQARTLDSFGFGIGGEFPETLGRVGVLRIGSLEVREPVTSFSDAQAGATATNAYDGTIGGGILRRFRVTFDYPHQEMYLEPNAEFSEPFTADTSGLILGAGGTDLRAITVLHVLSGTPAAQAGMKTGDVIVSLNGHTASTLGMEGVRSLFVNAGAYHLGVLRGQQNLKLDVTTAGTLY